MSKIEYPTGVFPQPSWIIQDSQLFGDSEFPGKYPLAGQLQVNLNEEGHIAGDYRFAVNGTDNLSATFPACKVLLCGGSVNYTLNFQHAPGDIEIPENSLATGWWDFGDSIADGTIKVTLTAGGSDDGSTLLKQMEKESNKTIKNGASFRFAVGADAQKRIVLQLQSLPLAAAAVKAKPNLCQTNTAVQVTKKLTNANIAGPTR